MNPVTKSQVPVAVSKITKFNLPSQCLTTGNFMQFNVAFNREIVPGSHGKLNHKTFIRANPLDKPCLGSAQIHNRAFFVPYRVIWEPFYDFNHDVPHNQPAGTGIIPNVPRINLSDVSSFFLQSGLSTSVTTPGAFDFTVSGTNYKLTPFGRQCRKIWESLGYKFVPSITGTHYVSALPLLSLAKVYIDWFYPSAYAHYGNYATIDGIMQRQVTYDLTVAELGVIFSAIYKVAYDNDFFTSVWDNPSAPSTGVGSVNFNIVDLTIGLSDSSKSKVTQTSTGTPMVIQGDSQSNNVKSFSQYIDSSLKALTNYVKRHQLVGSRALERALAEYGVSLTADRLKRCLYLGSDDFPFEIGDVMSTSDTSPSGGASLGAYAGKGVAYSSGKSYDFSTSNEEFGQLIVINTIVPDVAYTQGFDRNVLHLTKLDFLKGEFDALGPALVSQAEVLTSPFYDVNSFLTSGFGFAPRGYENKIPYSRFVGDWVCDSINTDLNGWSTMRLFDVSDYPTGIVHNLDFVLGKDSEQYDRIFLGMSSKDIVDPFYIVHRDDLEYYAPMKPLYDSYDFEELGKDKITFEPNGVRIN